MDKTEWWFKATIAIDAIIAAVKFAITLAVIAEQIVAVISVALKSATIVMPAVEQAVP